MQNSETNRSGYPLPFSQEGDRVEIIKCNGAKKLIAHLSDIGLSPGNRISIVQKNEENGIIVSFNDCKIALDNKTATGVVVTPCSPSSNLPGGCDYCKNSFCNKRSKH